MSATRPASPAGPPPGSLIVRVDAAGTALFALTAVAEAIVLTRALEVVGIAVAMGLFVVGCLAFIAGYARAIRRSRTDQIDVGNLFLLLGPAVPARTKRVLLSLLGVQVFVAVATAAARPFTTLAFGVLVPVFGVGLNGLWAANHGRFPPREIEERAASRPRRDVARVRAMTPGGGGDPPSPGGMEQNAGHG